MSKVKSFLLVAVAVTGATMASSCFAQHCSSCSSGAAPIQYAAAPQYAAPQYVAQPAVVGSSCNSCAAGGSSFAYPGGAGTAGLGVRKSGSCLHDLKAKFQHQRGINDRVEARNAAWPKPFGCADRQLYSSFFSPMIDRGYEEQCVLTSAHFDEKTHALNRFGQTAVAGIMQNMPSTRRQVFVNRDSDNGISTARKQSVEQTIRTFYGQMGPAMVSFSNKRPNTTTGVKGGLIQEAWLGNLATPAIPVSVGGDVASAVGGN